MALIRTYFTYIPVYFKTPDFPGGALMFPQDMFAYNFGPTETMHEDPLFCAHYLGEDCRRLAWVEGDDQHLSNGSTMTVSEFIVRQGLTQFSSSILTESEALALARIFSPSRVISRPVFPTGEHVQSTISEVTIIQGKLTQTIN